MKNGAPIYEPRGKGVGNRRCAAWRDFTIVDPLAETLNTEDVAVKTEVAWALGKLPDMRATNRSSPFRNRCTTSMKMMPTRISSN